MVLNFLLIIIYNNNKIVVNYNFVFFYFYICIVIINDLLRVYNGIIFFKNVCKFLVFFFFLMLYSNVINLC